MLQASSTNNVLKAENISRSCHPEGFLVKDVLKIWGKFTGEHSCRSVISINLQSNFIGITLWHWCSPVNLLHIFRTGFSKNTSGWLLLHIIFSTTLSVLIDLIDSKICHMQYIGRSQTKFNIRLVIHRKDVNGQKTPLADQYFKPHNQVKSMLDLAWLNKEKI